MGDVPALMSILPLTPPPLIGRDEDLRVCATLLAQTRLLTLTGPGGCGKTSLAIQLASTLCSSYPDGVWVVELAPLSDPSLVAETVRAALHADEAQTGAAPAQSPLEQMASALRNREVLVVLDNCEHVVTGCAHVVEHLLQCCPHLRIVATSREPLKCRGETQWLVPSLTLPRLTEDSTVEGLRSCGAVQLFVERACATVPGFDLTPDNAGLVACICQRLDGIPLALELCASYVKVLSLQQIDAALATDMRFLAGARRTAPTRQQTLYATMEWSYRLLSRDHQVVLCRLCALASDFGLDLAQVITDLPRAQVIESLSRLVDASLVQVVRHDDEVRYRLLETIKQFGRHQPAYADEAAATFERYCRWAESHVRSTSAASDGTQLRSGLDGLERELDHLRAALHWLLAQRKDERLMVLATELLIFWRQRGHITEGRRCLDTVLARCDPAATSPLIARTYNAAGVLALWQCDYERARSCHETALTILHRGAGDMSVEAMTRFRLGFLAEKCDQYTTATTYLEHSARLYRELGDDAGEQVVRSRLGLVYYQQGDWQRAWAYLEESLAFQRAHGATGAAASILLNLGIMALERGQIRRATPLLEESLALNRLVGDEHATIFTLTYLGFARLLHNDLMASERSFRQALDLVRADGNREILIRLIDGLAMVAARQGDPLFAARLWGSMSAQRAATGTVYRPVEQRLYDRERAGTRTRADPRAFEAAYTEGAALSLERALVCASAPFCPSGSVVRAESAPATRCPPTAQPELHVKACGTVHIWRGEQEITATDFVYAKARELLLYLLGSSARTKEQICLALWPDADQAHAHMRFRVVLYHVRRALGRPDWIIRSQHLYSFNRRLACGYEYDVEAFEAKVAEAKRLRVTQPKQAIALFEDAVALYDGDYAESLPTADWIAQRQDAVRHTYHDALLALASLRLLQGDTRRALATFQLLTAQNKYAEEAHRGVIQCYVRLHDFSQAAEYYNLMCAMFEDELGVAPAPETRAALQSTGVNASAST